MNARLVLAVALMLIVSLVAAATYSFSFEFSGNCPPDNKVVLKCFDLTGVIHISSEMQIGEKKTFNVDSSVQNLICVVICNGKVVYKKRFDLPGTPWKAVEGYPWDIARLDDLPNGTPVSSSMNIVIRNPDDCGNGEDDPGEGCDTGGNLGCDDPHKPVCYDCLYCGCGSDNDCPWVSGTRNCGDGGCPPWSRPVYGRECALGICVNPVKCEIDQECIDTYQAETQQPIPTVVPPEEPSIIGERAYDDAVMNVVLGYERFGGDSQLIPVDFCPECIQTGSLAGEGKSQEHDFPSGEVVVSFDGIEITADQGRIKAEPGAWIELSNGISLGVTEMTPSTDNEPGIVSYIITNLTDRQILDELYYAGTVSPGCDPLIVAKLMGADMDSMEGSQIDPELAALLGDARMNIHVDECTSHIITAGGVVVGIGEGELTDNTVNVYTDQVTLDEMDAGTLTFLDAYDAKRVRIEGEGFVEGLKFAIAEFLHNLSKVFG